ncbi:hypothetical protein CEF12_16860 [Enterococcus faecalis]|uniref:Uncharacterized protein n=1 Tax=Enterococcus faecalis TaxID=1351 RepID=A0A1Q1FR78_ENTFL|nr:hypothetical protein BZG32_02095 [Enterococcus faecalis]EGG56588.1 hypothetical protein HMPREF9520_01775 [Enterococcus faecalis TX1467]OOL67157.1 hypothetical protein B1P87_13650 [Enterococcus faecium]QGI54848.1 hypothetical protein EYB36_03015 [Enterococcus faecalis R712]ARE64791.1 hypothetical protein A4V06_14930 [Enterococcus faecalis]
MEVILNQLLLSKAHRNFTSLQVYGEPYGSIIIPNSNHRFLLTIKIILECLSLLLYDKKSWHN